MQKHRSRWSSFVRNSPLTWHKIQNDQEWSLNMKDILVDGKPLHATGSRL